MGLSRSTGCVCVDKTAVYSSGRVLLGRTAGRLELNCGTRQVLGRSEEVCNGKELFIIMYVCECALFCCFTRNMEVLWSYSTLE